MKMTCELTLVVVVLALISLAMAGQQICTQADCTEHCVDAPCVQTCNITDCRMNFSCSTANTRYCGVFCQAGACPEMSCHIEKGMCHVSCLQHGHCKNMISRGAESNLLNCDEGFCNMECLNYDSKCSAYCKKGNCSLKCKTKSCEFNCDDGNCNVTGGLGTRNIKFSTNGSNSRITCAIGNSCGQAGCDAKNNCVVYEKNPFNETGIPTAKPTVPTSAPKRPRGASETSSLSLWWMLIAFIALTFCQ